MCGIAGWVSFEEDVREKRDALEVMSAVLSRSCSGRELLDWLTIRECTLRHRLAWLTGGCR